MRRSPEPSVTLRMAREEDREALRRLAELDSSRVPATPMILAEVDGALLAATSVADGATVADPFAPTAQLVELLRLRAAHLRGENAPASARGQRRVLPGARRLLGLLGAGDVRLAGEALARPAPGGEGGRRG